MWHRVSNGIRIRNTANLKAIVSMSECVDIRFHLTDRARVAFGRARLLPSRACYCESIEMRGGFFL
jgi:hypothetical protein